MAVNFDALRSPGNLEQHNPYVGLPSSRYWKTGVAERHPMDVEDIYAPKFRIAPDDRIAVAGSCFAQHVGRHLRAHRFGVLDMEPVPETVPEALAQKFGYGIYSARYGNIYTVRQMLQLVRDSEGGDVRRDDVWLRDGRFFDAMRPGVEPDGLDSLEEAMAMRREHLGAVRELLRSASLVIFTLGLTEAWVNRRTGIVYPTCPGVIAGQFDPEEHQFVNFGFEDVYPDLVELRSLLKSINPDMRMLLTVSPVPLTATGTDQNVLVATTYSKSVLRAVCGSMSARFEDVDYFPSYELITSPAARSFYYEPNLRSVNPNGVAHVMRTFMKAHGVDDIDAGYPARDTDELGRTAPKRPRERKYGDVRCEDVLLEAFAK